MAAILFIFLCHIPCKLFKVFCSWHTCRWFQFYPYFYVTFRINPYHIVLAGGCCGAQSKRTIVGGGGCLSIFMSHSVLSLTLPFLQVAVVGLRVSAPSWAAGDGRGVWSLTCSSKSSAQHAAVNVCKVSLVNVMSCETCICEDWTMITHFFLTKNI